MKVGICRVTVIGFKFERYTHTPEHKPADTPPPLGGIAHLSGKKPTTPCDYPATFWTTQELLNL